MKTIAVIRARYEQLLECVVVFLMLGLALIIVIGFISRIFGHPFSWYDEVASVGLAWLTYYGAALAALKGAHISSPNLVNIFPPPLRVAAALLAETLVIGFFVVLGWTGLQVVMILKGSTLISLPEISLQLTQSVIPIASVLFIIARLLRLPEALINAADSNVDMTIDYELEEVLSKDEQHTGTIGANGSTDSRGDSSWR